MGDRILCIFSVGDRRCSKPPSSRGLCADHYSSAWYRVKRGRTTWQELADQGLAVLREEEKGSFLDRVAKARAADAEKFPATSLGDDGEEEDVDDEVPCRQIFFGESRGGVLLVGEAPNRRAHMEEREEEDALLIPRLVELSGVSEDEFSTIFGRTNLLSEWPGKSDEERGDRFPIQEASSGWQNIWASGILEDFDRVILLGRRVGSAVLGPNKPLPWFNWKKSRCGPDSYPTTQMDMSDGPSLVDKEIFMTCVPHPSGVSPWWNLEDNEKAARSFFRFLVDGARHRLRCQSCAFSRQPSFPHGPPVYQKDDGRWKFACDLWQRGEDLRDDFPWSTLSDEECRERTRKAHEEWLAREKSPRRP